MLGALRGREPFQRFARLPVGPPLIIIPQGNLVGGKFAWGRGYGAFSVSHSRVEEVAKYIARQEEHHRKRGFAEELRLLVERHGLKWREDKTVVTVSSPPDARTPR